MKGETGWIRDLQGTRVGCVAHGGMVAKRKPGERQEIGELVVSFTHYHVCLMVVIYAN